MRSIFTYPNNSATYYIDPVYWSSNIANPFDGNDGWWKRTDDLRLGNYLPWVETPDFGSTEEIAKAMGSYEMGYWKPANISSEELGMYDFYDRPIMVLERELAVNTISSIAIQQMPKTDAYSTTRYQPNPNLVSTGVLNNTWNMPLGTKYTVDWAWNTNDSLRDFYTYFLANSDLGNVDLFNVNSNLSSSRYALTEANTNSTDISVTNYPGYLVPVRTGGTKVITNSGRSLTYTDTGVNQWILYMDDTSSFTDGDAIYLGEYDDYTDFPTSEISLSTQIFTDVVSANSLALKSDVGLTNPITTTTDFHVYKNVSSLMFNDNYPSGNPQNDRAISGIFGYSTNDQGLTPIATTEFNELVELANNYGVGNRFPVLARVSGSGGWTRSASNTGVVIYDGFDYNTVQWASIFSGAIAGGTGEFYGLALHSTPDVPAGTNSLINLDASTQALTLSFKVLSTSPVGWVYDQSSIVQPSAGNNTVTVATSEPARNRLSTNYPQVVTFGNRVYQNTIAANTKANAAVYNDVYYEPGSNIPAVTTGESGASIAFNQDASGYLTGIALQTGGSTYGSGGLYTTAGDMIIQVDTAPDTYTPPAVTPIEAADTFDTDDQWLNPGFDDRKVWPDTVTPTSAEINYNAPTIVNNSQNGIKYSRSSGFTKWTLDVTYPAMTKEEFMQFNAISQASNGQAIPFFFNLRNKLGNPILWRGFYTGATDKVRVRSPITAGDTTMLVDGYTSNEANAFSQGEVFIDGENQNGYLHTALSGTAANVYGEAKIRVPWPFRANQAVGQFIYRNPAHAVVTLNSDDFAYSIDVNGYYFVSVSFSLDGWK